MIFLFVGFCILVKVSAWKKEMEDPRLHGGDMILTPEQLNYLKTGKHTYGSRIGYRWPNGVIPYVIDGRLGSQARQAINDAVADYHKNTCLKWIPAQRGTRAYVNFYQGGGCSSHVGFHNNRHDISLGNGCHDKGTAIHEMGHAIGLYHEQNRPDRDKYIRINKNNVESGMYYNFQLEHDVDSLGTPYDLRSIMHYSSTSFARDYRYRTITTIDPSQQKLIDHGDRINDFSPIDIVQINLMYNCGNVKPQTTTLPPLTAVPGACDNRDKDCQYFAERGWCTDNKERQWMKDNCCLACKSAQCLNRDSRCQEWANRGECNNNPNYMLRVCQTSCKQC